MHSAKWGRRAVNAGSGTPLVQFGNQHPGHMVLLVRLVPLWSRNCANETTRGRLISRGLGGLTKPLFRCGICVPRVVQSRLRSYQAIQASPSSGSCAASLE
jgi:hypothetical protein